MSDEISEGAPKQYDPLPHEREDDDDEPDHRRRSLIVTPEDRLTGVLVHWGGFLSWILAPLIFYVIQKNHRSLAGWHAREAFNFQLSLLIYYLLPTPLICLLFVDLDLLPIALLIPLGLMTVVMLFELVVVIWASVAAYHGQYFRIPLNIPFIPRPQISTDTDDHADFD